MARIFIDGFESGNVGAWDEVYNSIVSTSQKFTGSYGMWVNGAWGYFRKTVSAQTSYYNAFRWRSGGLYSRGMCSFREGDTVHINLESLVSGGSLYLTVKRGTTTLATGTTAMSANTWYLIELYGLVNDTTGVITVKLNGVEEINISSQDTRNGGAVGTIDNVRFGYAGVGNDGSSTYIDNVVIDSAGWIGDTRIGGLLIDGAGNAANWTPSAGSNYQTVDEVPESDSDYNYTNTVDLVDTFSVADMPAEAYSIKCVQAQARAARQGASTPQNIALAVRPPVGGTDYFSSDLALEAVYRGHVNLWETNPYTASSWTPTEVNSTEIGYKSRA